jgi:hypothetical protein
LTHTRTARDKVPDADAMRASNTAFATLRVLGGDGGRAMVAGRSAPTLQATRRVPSLCWKTPGIATAGCGCRRQSDDYLAPMGLIPSTSAQGNHVMAHGVCLKL